MSIDTPPAVRTSVAAGGRTRTLTVVGEGAAENARALVLVFHGSRQTGDVHRAFTGGALDDLAAAGTAVVAYLDGYRGNWNDARRESRFPARRDDVDDVAFVRAAVARLEGTHGIDPARVVAVGFSNGGQFVMRLLHEAPGELAAGVVISATMPVPASFLAPAGATAPERRPVVLVAGTRDPIIPFDGGGMRWWVRALFRIAGSALSASATADYFARRNGITAQPVTTEIPTGPNSRGTRTDRVDHREPGRAPVTLYVVHGGGHAVPGPTAAPALVGRTSGDISMADVVRELLEPAEADGIRRPAPTGPRPRRR
ncbi:alpha/beta hydrolase family esterase [Pseudolysinimonas sp.]|uniref:alpha/beta hydrolase family esterase n=1 Tax=Pseudolysinimonas sp. TaxID=2680009 RepID=UPI003783ADF8